MLNERELHKMFFFCKNPTNHVPVIATCHSYIRRHGCIQILGIESLAAPSPVQLQRAIRERWVAKGVEASCDFVVKLVGVPLLNVVAGCGVQIYLLRGCTWLWDIKKDTLYNYGQDI